MDEPYVWTSWRGADNRTVLTSKIQVSLFMLPVILFLSLNDLFPVWLHSEILFAADDSSLAAFAYYIIRHAGHIVCKAVPNDQGVINISILI